MIAERLRQPCLCCRLIAPTANSRNLHRLSPGCRIAIGDGLGNQAQHRLQQSMLADLELCRVDADCDPPAPAA